MKLKRTKSYKKQMSYLQMNFQFREPYQVLIDEELILDAVRTKYDLVKGLERTLQGEVKPMITQCTIEHLYRTDKTEAIELAKSFERRRCGHLPDKGETVSVFECLASIVEVNGQNKHRYVVATQKPKLRGRFRGIPAVPLIYINRSVMVMEPMSPATSAAREAIETAKLSEGLNKVPEKSTERTRKRGAKGPNPLSIKKRKVADEGPGKRRGKRGKKRGDGEGDADGESGNETGEPNGLSPGADYGHSADSDLEHD